MIEIEVNKGMKALAIDKTEAENSPRDFGDGPKYAPVKPDLILNMLPTVVLDVIFEYVQSYDLLKIMALSSKLYGPAAARVYMSISILRVASFPKAVTESRDWKVNYGTLMPTNKVHILAESLKKKERLRGLVRTLSRSYQSVDKPVRELVSLTPNLRSYHDTHGFAASRRIEGNFVKYSGKISFTPRLNSYLVECRFIFPVHGWHPGAEDLVQLARNLIESECHVNLRKLEFLVVGGYDLRSERIEDVCLLPFFDEFAKEKIKLGLHSLSLFGKDCSSSAEKFANGVKKSVELANLRSLVLNLPYIFDRPDSPCLLNSITKDTPSLVSLAVFDTHRMSFRRDHRFDRLSQVLKCNIPNQLRDLFIETRGPSTDTKMKEGIAASQQNLAKLAITQIRPQYYNNDTLDFRSAIREMRSQMFEALKCEKWRKVYYPEVQRDLHFRPLVPELYVQRVEQWKEEIQAHLRKDVIYSHADSHLPELTQYYVDGMFIDVKCRGIFANDRTIFFGAEEKQVYSDNNT